MPLVSRNQDMQTKTQEQEAEEHNLEPQTVRGKCAVTYWLSRSQSSGLPPMAISGVGIPPNRFPLVPRLSYRIKYTVAGWLVGWLVGSFTLTSPEGYAGFNY